MKQLLYIDLFCGAGGTSTGVERARLGGKKCARVIACVNHDPNAIKSHEPSTLRSISKRIKQISYGKRIIAKV